MFGLPNDDVYAVENDDFCLQNKGGSAVGNGFVSAGKMLVYLLLLEMIASDNTRLVFLLSEVLMFLLSVSAAANAGGFLEGNESVSEVSNTVVSAKKCRSFYNQKC